MNSSKLQARIIQMHINLIQTVEQLDRIIPLSERVCRSQDTNNPVNCSFR